MKKTDNTPSTSLTTLSTDEAHRHTGGAALLGHTGHTVTNGVLGASVCHIFSIFFFVKNGEEQEQSTGKWTQSETLLVKAESF